MSQENVEVIRRGVALANENDDPQAVEAAVAELYHPDVEQRDLQHPPDVPEVVRGRAAVVAGLRKWIELFDDWSVEVHEYIDADPWVVCDTRWRATGKGSDVSIDWHVADAHEVKDGKTSARSTASSTLRRPSKPCELRVEMWWVSLGRRSPGEPARPPFA